MPPSNSAGPQDRAARTDPPQVLALLTGAWRSLRGDRFLQILLAGLVVLSALDPTRIHSYANLVDWPTISTLTGLLMLTKGLEVSGALRRLGHWLIGFISTERSAALVLVLSAALLSTVLTNDVALFVAVPLTLGLCRVTKLPATQLIVFEALAVNVGSALTPIGNPQNLFLWQLSKVSFAGFVGSMLPLVALLAAALLLATAVTFDTKPVQVRDNDDCVPLDRPLLAMSLGLYVPFLIAADLHHADLAAAAVVGVFVVLRPRILVQFDWGLLLVFVLMFIDLRLFAGMTIVRDAMSGLGLDQTMHLYVAAIGASQAVSNVPAAIALAEYSKDWQQIAYGVNVGGFGWAVGSLANLIALRLSGDRKAWIVFHRYSIPALVVSAVIGWALLRLSA